MCHCGQNTRYCRRWSLGSSNFLSVKKHDDSRRTLDLVAIGEFLVVRGVNPEDFLFGFHHIRHLLEDRFDLSAVNAPVRHEFNRDWSLSFQNPRLEGTTGDGSYMVARHISRSCSRVL